MKQLGRWLWRYILVPIGYSVPFALAIMLCVICGVVGTLCEMHEELTKIPLAQRRLVQQLSTARTEAELLTALKALADADRKYLMFYIDDMLKTLRWGALAQLATLRREYLPRQLAMASSVAECRKVLELCYLGMSVSLLADISNAALDKMRICLERDLELAGTIAELREIQRWTRYHHSQPWKGLQARCVTKLKQARKIACMQLYFQT